MAIYMYLYEYHAGVDTVRFICVREFRATQFERIITAMGRIIISTIIMPLFRMHDTRTKLLVRVIPVTCHGPTEKTALV